MKENDMSEWLAQEPDAYTTIELDAMAEDVAAKEKLYDKAHQMSKDCYEALEEAKAKLQRALEATGKKKYFVAGLGDFGLRTTMTVTTPKSVEAKKLFSQYIVDKYGEDAAWEKISVNHQTLNSFYNAEWEIAQEKGETEFNIPGIEQPIARTTLTIRRSK